MNEETLVTVEYVDSISAVSNVAARPSRYVYAPSPMLFPC